MEKRVVSRDVSEKSNARGAKHCILWTPNKLDKRAFFFFFHVDHEEKWTKGLKETRFATLSNEKRRSAS